MESTLLQGSGYINLNIGMEIRPTAGMPAEHPHLEKQVMQLSIGQKNVNFDTMTISIQNADLTGANDSVFKLRYSIPDSDANDIFVSEEIVAGGEWWEFRDAIKGYYKDRFG